MSRFKTVKRVVKENPALVIATINTVAITALTVVVIRKALDTNLALACSTIALKIALGEIKI